MKISPLPILAYLQECFILSDNGILSWKARPREHFRTYLGFRIWNGKYAGKVAGARRSDGRLSITINDKHYRSNRIIWALKTGADPGDALVDHRNIDHTEDDIDNLRLADHSQNRANSPGHKDRQSRFKGVYPLRGEWAAAVCFRGERRFLGTFIKEEDAAAAYATAAAEMQGDFAYHQVET